MRSAWTYVLILGFILAGSVPAFAADENLLSNPGFETGDLTGWTISGNTPNYGVATDGTLIPATFAPFGNIYTNVRSGTYSGWSNVRGFSKVSIKLSQTFDVAPNSTYDVGYYVGVDSPSEFGYGMQAVVTVNSSTLSLTGVFQLDNTNGGNGSGPSNFRHVFGSYTTGATETSVTVTYEIWGSGTGQSGFSFDDFHFTGPPAVIPVDLDIKPGSDTNPVNLKSKGVIPVAILGGADFDVTDVDVDSLSFGPDGASEAHGEGHVEDVNDDGYDDLVLHFDTQESGIAEGDTEAMLTGQTIGGVAIEGVDSITTTKGSNSGK